MHESHFFSIIFISIQFFKSDFFSKLFSLFFQSGISSNHFMFGLSCSGDLGSKFFSFGFQCSVSLFRFISGFFLRESEERFGLVILFLSFLGWLGSNRGSSFGFRSSRVLSLSSNLCSKLFSFLHNIFISFMRVRFIRIFKMLNMDEFLDSSYTGIFSHHESHFSSMTFMMVGSFFFIVSFLFMCFLFFLFGFLFDFDFGFCFHGGNGTSSFFGGDFLSEGFCSFLQISVSCFGLLGLGQFVVFDLISKIISQNLNIVISLMVMFRSLFESKQNASLDFTCKFLFFFFFSLDFIVHTLSGSHVSNFGLYGLFFSELGVGVFNL